MQLLYVYKSKQISTIKIYKIFKLNPDEKELLNISEMRKVIGNLKKYDSVIISKPDKSKSCLVWMFFDKTDYINKIQEIIGDKKLLGPANKFDYINKVEDGIVKIFKNLL